MAEDGDGDIQKMRMPPLLLFLALFSASSFFTWTFFFKNNFSVGDVPDKAPLDARPVLKSP